MTLLCYTNALQDSTSYHVAIADPCYTVAKHQITSPRHNKTRPGITLLHQRNTYYRFAIPSLNIAKHHIALPLHAVTILSNTHAKPSRAIPYHYQTRPYFITQHLADAKQNTTRLNHCRTKLNRAIPSPYQTSDSATLPRQNNTRRHLCMTLRRVTVPYRYLDNGKRDITNAGLDRALPLRNQTEPSGTIPKPPEAAQCFTKPLRSVTSLYHCITGITIQTVSTLSMIYFA